MEIFYSIQGEGFHSGKPAIFVRLGGCDVGCVWCDVKESWNEEDHPFLTIDEILTELKQYPCKTLIITGGEPLMY
ncbi:7-carboxy-7-deazaguanine synthase QueE, partial [Reichenbachiella sp.]|uniref:7-carboxy-7-deazaguanine synthase QueE n=1 Tax=Reichenbachiella sp. TaxID=2184521 RepID=UPI003B5BF6BB